MDYAEFREAADANGAYLLADMAHIGGLVAAGLVPQSPFEYADFVTTTIHKTLRGPRAALLFFKKSTKLNEKLGDAVNNSVFPGHLGGPHNHTISAVTTCLKQAATQEFRDYQKQVLLNAKFMGDRMMERGYELVTNGTVNHMILMSLKSTGIDGSQAEYIMQNADITVNKNTIKGDKSALRPSGLRLGSPAMTTRGCKEEHFAQISEMIHESILLAKDLSSPNDKILTFKKRVNKALEDKNHPVNLLKKKVNSFSSDLPFNFNENMI